MFNVTEKILVDTHDFTASTFQYSTGVEALRIKIGHGEFIWLPFLGQSLWSWKVDGVEQKFEGFLEEPSYQAKDFLHNYGAFLINCGITAMGNPSKADTHPHHGELPNAKYCDAWLEISEGAYPISLCGLFSYHVPFKASYDFSAALRISRNGSSVFIDDSLVNRQKTPLQYMYLSHLNFTMRGARKLVYGVKEFTKANVCVLNEVIPGIIEDPSLFLKVNEIPLINPELVAIFKNHGKYGKVCTSKMLRDDGTMIWTAINTDGLDHTVVWLTKTPDRLACGFCLPSTAGPRGFLSEEKLGNVKTLEVGESVKFQYVFGLEKKNEVASLENAIILLGGHYD
jgi:hypothetical protein